jgi:hypothetical protein
MYTFEHDVYDVHICCFAVDVGWVMVDVTLALPWREAVLLPGAHLSAIDH